MKICFALLIFCLGNVVAPDTTTRVLPFFGAEALLPLMKEYCRAKGPKGTLSYKPAFCLLFFPECKDTTTSGPSTVTEEKTRVEICVGLEQVVPCLANEDDTLNGEKCKGLYQYSYRDQNVTPEPLCLAKGRNHLKNYCEGPFLCGFNGKCPGSVKNATIGTNKYAICVSVPLRDD